MIYFSLKCLGITVPSQGAQHTWWKVSIKKKYTQQGPTLTRQVALWDTIHQISLKDTYVWSDIQDKI